MRGERRCIAVLRIADIEKQCRAQSRHQMRGHDVGFFLGAADPLPQVIETVGFCGYGFCLEWLGAAYPLPQVIEIDGFCGYGFCHDWLAGFLERCAGLGERLAVSEGRSPMT